MPGRRPILASLLATVLVMGSVGGVAAQMPPYTAYGMGLQPTDTVTATIEGIECGSARVSVAGKWKSIPADAPCHPTDGATIHFGVNGKEHTATVRWSGGGAPLNPRVGVALSAATATPTATATPKATAIASKAPTTKATPSHTKAAGQEVADAPRLPLATSLRDMPAHRPLEGLRNKRIEVREVPIEGARKHRVEPRPNAACLGVHYERPSTHNAEP